MEKITVNGKEYVRVCDVPKNINKKAVLPKVIPEDRAPYIPGNFYLVRTVTNYIIGQLVAVGQQELVFTQAGWLADTGRFNNALKTGNVNEFEPAASPDDEIIVGRGAIIDCWPWNFPNIFVVQK